MATDPFGIDDGWHDTTGAWHPTPDATHRALRRAMGADADAAGPPPGRDVWVLRPGEAAAVPRPRRLVLEDGTDLGEVTTVPPDVPIGLHALADDEDPGVTLVVSPGRCHLPEDLRAWGCTMQVPTVRSARSWGVGDLGDVAAVARWLAGRGGSALGLSPLHAATPVGPLPASPYRPSSRRWHHPLLLAVEDLPGAADHPEVADLAARGRALLDRPLVDRDASWALKAAALEHLWADRRAVNEEALTAFRRRHGGSLERWAMFCALAEVHGPSWRRWPEALRHPDAPEVARATGPLADRVAFHAWLQLLLAEQLERAARSGVRLVQDLAIGVDPDGADGWALQDLLAHGVSVGAPPDDFAPLGQDWGLPPFVPWRLRDAGYRPLAELLRAGMADGGGLRVDHVMGLSRLFWIPAGAPPAEGTYVRYAGRELLEVLALESARAGALVVGEDLGTVEPELREALGDTRVLSTRLVWFEDDPPEAYPERSLAMVTTHDLPTVAGLWSGADDAELERVGRPSPPEQVAEVRRRAARLGHLDPDHRRPEDVPVLLERLHDRLGRAASVLALATLEDVAGVAERPNVPGTVDERPNWSIPLPLRADDLDAAPQVEHVVDPLRAARGPAGGGD